MQPNAHLQEADPGEDDQPKQPFEPFGLGDAGPLQVEASSFEASKRAFDGPAELIQLPRLPDAEIRGDDDKIPLGGSCGDHAHPLPEDLGLLRNHAKLPLLNIIKPFVCSKFL